MGFHHDWLNPNEGDIKIKISTFNTRNDFTATINISSLVSRLQELQRRDNLDVDEDMLLEELEEYVGIDSTNNEE